MNRTIRHLSAATYMKGNKMKITATYRTCIQCGPDDYEAHTKVIHLLPTDTLEVAFEKITVGWKNKDNVDVELHFEQTLKEK